MLTDKRSSGLLGSRRYAVAMACSFSLNCLSRSPLSSHSLATCVFFLVTIALTACDTSDRRKNKNSMRLASTFGLVGILRNKLGMTGAADTMTLRRRSAVLGPNLVSFYASVVAIAVAIASSAIPVLYSLVHTVS
jgi:hypothetical protein